MKNIKILLTLFFFSSMFALSQQEIIESSKLIGLIITHSKLIIIILLFSLLFLNILNKKNILNIKPIMILLLIFQISISIIYLYKGYLIEFIVLIFISGGLFFFFSIKKDKEILIESLYYSSILFLATIILQSLSSIQLLFTGERFSGILQNPQSSAIVISLLIPIIIYKFINTQTKKQSIFRFIVLGIFIILLLLTASRTGILITLIGSLFIFKNKKISRLILPISFLLILIIIFIIINPINIDLERITSNENTRSQTWNLLLQDFKENLLFGSNFINQGPTSNSYLLAGAWFGIIPFILLIFFSISTIIYISKSKNKLSKFSILAILLGALFEGYLLSIISFQIVLLYLHLSILDQ